jgi:diguanylate cyclase (GGDEF)-like protein
MSRTLLLVDDEPNVLKALKRTLRTEGYKILTADSGREALALLNQHDVGVIVSDHRMPEMTGIDLLIQVRVRYPDIIRIILTAYTDLKAATDAINRGAVYKFLMKPHDDAMLRQVLAEAFEHHELIRENQRLMTDLERANRSLEELNQDLEQRVREKSQELIRTAHYDALTGLPNRLLLTERAEQALLRARRHGHVVALMVLDLDHFKLFNDSLGHDAADHLLKAAAGRITQCVRTCDSVARPGGDEFIILLTDIEAERHVGLIANKIKTAFGNPFKVDDQEIYLTASAGISLFPNDGESFEHLLNNAESALYICKESDRGSYRFYTREMNARARERLMLETGLRGALDRGEFVLHYQPQVDLVSGTIVGVESLLRWQHPEFGLVQPDDFIWLLEETGMIDQVGEWVLRTAAERAMTWREMGHPMRISVNISARQFRRQDLARRIRGILAQVGLDASTGQLELELTESVVMHDVESALAILGELHAMGIKLSIDDFGTGYSSLSYLRRFPIHTLKIDQSFIRDLNDDPNDASIVGAIIALAHSLNLNVIAEGVETQVQLAFLRAHGCNEMQGFLFSRPIPAELIDDLLFSGKKLALRSADVKEGRYGGPGA